MDKSDISRQNGAKSKGPKTAEGKKKSALNATRHGLTSQLITVSGEGKADFEIILKELLDHFQPVGPVEKRLVNALANAEWRQNRLWAYEASLINNRIENDRDSVDRDWHHIEPHDRAALAFERLNNWEKAFPSLTRYEASLRRGYHKALKDLKEEQKERRDGLGSFSQFSKAPVPRPPAVDHQPPMPTKPAPQPKSEQPVAPEPRIEPPAQPAASIFDSMAQFQTAFLLLLIVKASHRRELRKQVVRAPQPSPVREPGRQERIVPRAPMVIPPSVRYSKEKCGGRVRRREDK